MTDFYNMTPKEIVEELDKYIIGQDSAKKSVAIALRNRHRRNQLPDEMREEVTPKNILMIGPTGCGKTEIARRLARIMKAPFVKVEATKFTEVGYVGRDVDSIIRDLVEASIRLTKHTKMEEKYEMADKVVEDLIVDAMIPGAGNASTDSAQNAGANQQNNPFAFISNIPGMSGYFQPPQQQTAPPQQNTDDHSTRLAREQVRQQLRNGLLEDQMIDIDVIDNSSNMIDIGGNENMSISIGNIFGNSMPPRTKKRRVKVKDARRILRDQEAQKLLDMDQITADAVDNAEQNGIVFIDEMDKIADDSQYGRGPGVSREGVQRGQHKIRPGQNGSYSVHRCRRVPCVQADGPDSRAPGPFPDPGGTEKPDQGRSEEHSGGSEERHYQAAENAAGNRKLRCGVHG